MFKQGTVVLVPFPFSDLSATKVRPAVVLSSVEHGDDVIFAFISSVASGNDPFDIKIKKTDSDFGKTGLKVDSTVRIAKIATLDKKIILGTLGMIGSGHLKQTRIRLRQLFSL